MIQRIDGATGEVVESWGNCRFMVDLTDGDIRLPRSCGADTISMTILRADGSLWAQIGKSTSPVTIGGGNLIVRSK